MCFVFVIRRLIFGIVVNFCVNFRGVCLIVLMIKVFIVIWIWLGFKMNMRVVMLLKFYVCLMDDRL